MSNVSRLDELVKQCFDDLIVEVWSDPMFDGVELFPIAERQARLMLEEEQQQHQLR